MIVKYDKETLESCLVEISAKELDEQFNGDVYEFITHITQDREDLEEIQEVLDVNFDNVEKILDPEDKKYYKQKPKEYKEGLEFLKDGYLEYAYKYLDEEIKKQLQELSDDAFVEERLYKEKNINKLINKKEKLEKYI